MRMEKVAAAAPDPARVPVPGSPADGSGAGYGGNLGGMSSSNAVGGTVYGSFAQPTNSGSGGGASYAGVGGAGGGTIQITAGGTFTINGTISADGANGTSSRSGGGSGGSIGKSTAHRASGQIATARKAARVNRPTAAAAAAAALASSRMGTALWGRWPPRVAPGPRPAERERFTPR